MFHKFKKSCELEKYKYCPKNSANKIITKPILPIHKTKTIHFYYKKI